MEKKCILCKKGPLTGKALVRKGLLKKKGGTGSKISRVSKRKFLPNLQKIRILIDTHPKNVYVCTKCIKKGSIVRA
jgi:large subunit ribosomal protein L28